MSVEWHPALPLVLSALCSPLLPRPLRQALALAAPVLAWWGLGHWPDGTWGSLTVAGLELTALRLDPLARVFAVIFILFAFLANLFALSHAGRWQQAASLLYAGSAVGATLAGDLITLLVWWELMGVSSVVLIWARGTREAAGAGWRFLLVHIVGGALLLGGSLLHHASTGSWTFEHLPLSAGGWCILASFAINAAIPPLHGWLADSYPEGTPTGSVFLCAFTTKVAVYALLRGFAGVEWLMWAGALMALYGVIFAVLENDIRRLLAYHIISQVGYMVCGIGIGTDFALNGSAAHAFCHILYKGLLFMATGAVLQMSGRSKLTDLGGLARAMPFTMICYMVGAFSISSVPLFNGFISKSIIVEAAAHHDTRIELLLIVASMGTFLHTGLKLPFFTFFAAPNPRRTAQDPPFTMRLAMALTALLCLAIGVAPGLLYQLLPYPVHFEPYTPIHVVQTLQLLLWTALGFWILRHVLGGQATVTLDTDWMYRRGFASLARRGIAMMTSVRRAAAAQALARWRAAEPTLWREIGLVEAVMVGRPAFWVALTLTVAGWVLVAR